MGKSSREDCAELMGIVIHIFIYIPQHIIGGRRFLGECVTSKGKKKRAEALFFKEIKFNVWRTGSSGGPFCDRTFYVQQHGRLLSGTLLSLR